MADEPMEPPVPGVTRLEPVGPFQFDLLAAYRQWWLRCQLLRVCREFQVRFTPTWGAYSQTDWRLAPLPEMPL